MQAGNVKDIEEVADNIHEAANVLMGRPPPQEDSDGDADDDQAAQTRANIVQPVAGEPIERMIIDDLMMELLEAELRVLEDQR
jgi:hypothetical protein